MSLLSNHARRAIVAMDAPACHQHEIWLPPLTEDECRQLMAGQAPDWLRERCRELLDWSLETGRLDFEGLRETQQRRTRSA